MNNKFSRKTGLGLRIRHLVIIINVVSNLSLTAQPKDPPGIDVTDILVYLYWLSARKNLRGEAKTIDHCFSKQ